jgi:hypothetical protein
MTVVRLEFDGGVLREGREVDAKAPIERERERKLRSLHSINKTDYCVDSRAAVCEGAGSGKNVAKS